MVSNHVLSSPRLIFWACRRCCSALRNSCRRTACGPPRPAPAPPAGPGRAPAAAERPGAVLLLEPPAWPAAARPAAGRLLEDGPPVARPPGRAMGCPAVGRPPRLVARCKRKHLGKKANSSIAACSASILDYIQRLVDCITLEYPFLVASISSCTTPCTCVQKLYLLDQLAPLDPPQGHGPLGHLPRCYGCQGVGTQTLLCRLHANAKDCSGCAYAARALSVCRLCSLHVYTHVKRCAPLWILRSSFPVKFGFLVVTSAVASAESLVPFQIFLERCFFKTGGPCSSINLAPSSEFLVLISGFNPFPNVQGNWLNRPK